MQALNNFSWHSKVFFLKQTAPLQQIVRHYPQPDSQTGIMIVKKG